MTVPIALWVGHSTDRARLWVQRGRVKVKVTLTLAGAPRGSSEASRQGFCPPGAGFRWEETDSRQVHPRGGAYRVVEETEGRRSGGGQCCGAFWGARKGFLDGVRCEPRALRRWGSKPYRKPWEEYARQKGQQAPRPQGGGVCVVLGRQ